MQVMVGNSYGSYTFNHATRQITLANLPSPLVPGQIKLIVNASSNTMIFNLVDPTLTATVAGNIITLAFDTTTMNDLDALQIIMDVPERDNVVLENSITISTTGPGRSYDTTGFQRISMQLGGAWTGNVYFEGSNCGQIWFRLHAFFAEDGSAWDYCDTPGSFTLPCSTKFVRYNVAGLFSGSIIACIVGKASPQEASSLVAQSYDIDTGVMENVNIAGGLQRDANGGVILSDCAPVKFSLSIVNSVYTIDTIGYQSLQISVGGGGVFPLAGSNDGISFSIKYAIPINANGSQAAQATNTIAGGVQYVMACDCRYIRFQATVAGWAVGWLRTGPAPAVAGQLMNANINQVGGNAAANAGGSGVLAVGGAHNIGNAAFNYPVQIGGADPAGLTRRVLLTPAGHIYPGGLDAAGNSRGTAMLPPTTNAQNLAALVTNDVSNYEGQTLAELMAQVLVELRIHSYLLFNLPQWLGSGQTPQLSDEPASLRNEPSTLN